jgi:hypothetical protein
LKGKEIREGLGRMTTERNLYWLRLSLSLSLASVRRDSALTLGERWGGEEWSGVRGRMGRGRGFYSRGGRR